MRQTEPPVIAVWMLQHLSPGPRNEALAGDLFEEFCSGRSTGWYWRQVLAAVVIGCFRELLNHRFTLVFAALWSILAPAWLLIIASLEEHFQLSERIWQMDWPWSTISYLSLILAANLIFIWTGLVLYLVPHLCFTRTFGIRRLSRGVLASVPVLFVLCVALIVLPVRFLQQGHAVDRPPVTSLSSYTITDLGPIVIQRPSPQEEWDMRYGENAIDLYRSPRHAITDMRLSSLIVRLPFFLSILCTLWMVTSRPENRRTRIAA